MVMDQVLQCFHVCCSGFDSSCFHIGPCLSVLPRSAVASPPHLADSLGEPGVCSVLLCYTGWTLLRVLPDPLCSPTFYPQHFSALPSNLPHGHWSSCVALLHSNIDLSSSQCHRKERMSERGGILSFAEQQ